MLHGKLIICNLSDIDIILWGLYIVQVFSSEGFTILVNDCNTMPFRLPASIPVTKASWEVALLHRAHSIVSKVHFASGFFSEGRVAQINNFLLQNLNFAYRSQ